MDDSIPDHVRTHFGRSARPKVIAVYVPHAGWSKTTAHPVFTLAEAARLERSGATRVVLSTMFKKRELWISPTAAEHWTGPATIVPSQSDDGTAA